MALGSIVLVVALATVNMLSTGAFAVMAEVARTATGYLDVGEAYESVDRKIIFLIFGMMASGLAMEKTPGAELVARAHSRLGLMGSAGGAVGLRAEDLCTDQFSIQQRCRGAVHSRCPTDGDGDADQLASVSHRGGARYHGVSRNGDWLSYQDAGPWRGRVSVPGFRQGRTSVGPPVLCAAAYIIPELWPF